MATPRYPKTDNWQRRRPPIVSDLGFNVDLPLLADSGRWTDHDRLVVLINSVGVRTGAYAALSSCKTQRAERVTHVANA